MMIEPAGEPVSDKPEVDFQRLEHLEEIRQREHAATLRLFEIYRERLDNRRDARAALSEIERILDQYPGRKREKDWQERLEKAQSALAETERRVAEATRARDEASERYQTAGALYERCTEWCRENRIEVAR